MFCIAAFVTLAAISIFSAKYRTMAKKAWGCVGKKVTLRACDTSFKNDLKDKMLSKVAAKTPKMVKAADIGIEVAAFLFVILTVWSVYVAVKSGLNLYVYGTCNTSNSEACNLGAEACSIESGRGGIVSAIKSGDILSWVGNEFKDFGKTVVAIPTRMQTWDANEYLPTSPSYLKPIDNNKPTALEIIDPGCQYCRQLYSNLKEAGFADRYNLTYIAYPIPKPNESGAYKFPNSKLVVQYLEAVKLTPQPNDKTPIDWQMLDRIFTGKDEKGTDYQTKINVILNGEQTKELLEDWLLEFGYTPDQVKEISEKAQSSEVEEAIGANSKIVTNSVKTLKVPTIIFDGRRREGALTVDDLR